MAPTVSAEAGDVSGQNWDRMMAAAQAGDANAYRTLLAELALWLRRYYARRLPSAMTEDAVQDVLLAIHEKRHTYDPVRPFGPWLAAIARYKWIDRLRSLKTEATEPLDEKHRGARSRRCCYRRFDIPTTAGRTEASTGRSDPAGEA